MVQDCTQEVASLKNDATSNSIKNSEDVDKSFPTDVGMNVDTVVKNSGGAESNSMKALLPLVSVIGLMMNSTLFTFIIG